MDTIMKLLSLLMVVLVLIGMVASQKKRKRRGLEVWIRPKHNPPGTRHCNPGDHWCQRD
ncbi:uncharacterized protein LOC122617236 [Drosophila teissieri]|uniref:uncharacterized protein LOC122617236 n=1 Tax=Drosophila teissieri TaxID=7243 RepID=UPI001CB9FCCE|nr:uncharacterized protein LOC122617236 [Drosophila teissieri]